MVREGPFGVLARNPARSRALRGMAAGLMSLLALGWIVEQAGPSRGEVVVHVTAPDVRVTIDGWTLPAPDRGGTPLVSELPFGWHEVVMERGGRVLHRESFELRRGENCVLADRDPRPR